MNTRPSWIAAILIAAASGTGGWFLGRASAPMAVTPAAAPAQAKSPRGGTVLTDHGKPRLSADELAGLKAKLAAETNPLERFKLATARMEAWMNADPIGAIGWIHSQEPSARRNELLRMALGQFAENDPKGAAEWSLANLSGIELNNLLIRIAEQWARQDAPGAAAWFTAMPVTEERNAALETLLFRWSSEDPQAAVAWLASNPASAPLDAILRYAAYAGWAKTDPRGAVAASLESSRRLNDPGQFASTIANWATVDLTASSAWLLENVKDTGEREPAVSELAAIFAHQSPQAGLDWIKRLTPAEQPAALNRLTSAWAQSDPPSAAKWLGAAQPDGLEPETTTAVIQGFLAADAKGFQEWQAGLPPGPLKNRAAELTASPPGESSDLPETD
jgi:hypothetical protein